MRRHASRGGVAKQNQTSTNPRYVYEYTRVPKDQNKTKIQKGKENTKYTQTLKYDGNGHWVLGQAYSKAK